MKDWYSGIYKGLICACVVAFLVGFFQMEMFQWIHILLVILY